MSYLSQSICPPPYNQYQHANIKGPMMKLLGMSQPDDKCHSNEGTYLQSYILCTYQRFLRKFQHTKIPIYLSKVTYNSTHLKLKRPYFYMNILMN